MKDPKGYSLVEFSLSALLGTILLTGVIVTTRHSVGSFKADQARFEMRSELHLAAQSLQNELLQSEPSFWTAFPQNFHLPHSGDQTGHGTSWSDSCPREKGTGCLTIFDIEAPDQAPSVWELEDVDWPRSVRLAPIHGQGKAHDRFKAMDVLLFQAEGEAFCAMVQRQAHGHVFLANQKDQPWALPSSLAFDSYQVTQIGRLQPLHFFLRKLKGRGRQLVRQPWHLDQEQGWKPARSRSSFAHLLEWRRLEKSETGSTELALLSIAPSAARLKTPLEIAGKTYWQEVSHVAIGLW